MKYKKYLTEQDKELKTIIIKVNDPEDQLIKLIEYIRNKANPGHSFPVIVDPDDSEYKKTFYFDGDGVFHIDSLKIT